MCATASMIGSRCSIRILSVYRVTNPGQAEGVCGFIEEKFIAEETLSNGSTWDVDTSADRKQSCLYNPDGSNQKVWILERKRP